MHTHNRARPIAHTHILLYIYKELCIKTQCQRIEACKRKNKEILHCYLYIYHTFYWNILRGGQCLD